MNKLNIFVSSTCYDLSQIRTDLSEFISNQGHSPVLSEFDNFPVNPHRHTFDNCIEAVKNNADIFILVVGNRYGSITDNQKSITNTEFLTAKAKNIPIFVFIDKKTLSTFYFWKENKNADFSKFVDNTAIFEFIADIRENNRLWSFEFEKAQDIIHTLKYQFSYLFKESLKIYSNFNKLGDDILNLDLSNEAINILLAKDTLYEYEFFSKVLIDEMEKTKHLRNDLAYRIHFAPTKIIDDIHEVNSWMSGRIPIIVNLINSFSNLINNAFHDFIKGSNVASDLQGLFYVAKAYSRTYEAVINWTIDTRNTVVPEECEKLRDCLSLYSKDCLEKIWEYPKYINEQIAFAKNEIKIGNNDISLNLSLSIKVGEEEVINFNEEFEKYKQLVLYR